MDSYIRDFKLYLQANGKAKQTINIYVWAAQKLQKNLDIQDWTSVTKSHIREHMAWLHENVTPGYANNQFRALQQFFRFLEMEEEIPNPMKGMKPPPIPEKLVPVISEQEYRKLLQCCTGKHFLDYRDRAIIEFFRSTGARRSEVSGLRITDVDLEQLAAIVTGKASRMRIVRFDAQTGLAISRYLRVRKSHKYSASEMLWVGMDGPLHPSAIYQMFKRRGKKAGVWINPHRFRHDFSHRYLLNGGQEVDLMQQNGWSSISMLRRYGASAASQRAREHYDKVMGT